MPKEETGTLLSFRPAIKVVDATLRDGGLVNNFRFSDAFVRALADALAAAGVDYMELGYKADPDMFDEAQFGKWKFCREAEIDAVFGGASYGIKFACMADVGRCNFQRDIPPKSDSRIDLYRIATYINTIPAAIEMIEHCTKQGYETTVNIMAVSKATEREVSIALDLLGASPVNAIYIVDSYGSLYPEEIRALAAKYLEAGAKYGKQIGIHAHNNQNLAFANTIECAAAGVNYLDATVSGMGRGAGNCATELLLGFLKNPKYKLDRILSFLEAGHMEKLRAEGARWGYDLPYLLTGIFNRHPSAAIRYTAAGRKDITSFYREILSEE